MSRPSAGSPGIAGNRPGPGPNRPGPGDRPVIGGGGNRPIIGGGGNNVINRPGGDHDFAHRPGPGWGLGEGGRPGGGPWGGHAPHPPRPPHPPIPPHHNGWYHGGWNRHWNNFWYAPVVVGATAWGLNALWPAWSNPYYVASPESSYDYSQPIVVNNYETPAAAATSDQQAATPAAEAPQTAELYQAFDQALAAFKAGDYQGALALDRQALKKSPQDPAMHEIAALCLFATGDYTGAAAVLNSLLAVTTGMDWTTMSGLYGNVEAYTAQLRALEAHSREKPDDAAAHFVLAYHYLVTAHGEAAADQLRRVVAAQPGDQVAKRMLAALTPAAEAPTAPAPTAAASPAQAAPTTDLVGSWRAERNGDVFELSIDENNQFTWKAISKGKPTSALNGALTAAGNAILLQSKDQGTMAAQVTSGGVNQFQFVVAGSPPDDKGLSFQRVTQGG